MKWSGADSHPRFESEDDLIDYLQKTSIDYVVVDVSMPEDKRGMHHDQLRHVAEDRTDVFWPMASAPIVRGGATDATPLRMYRMKYPAGDAPEIKAAAAPR